MNVNAKAAIQRHHRRAAEHAQRRAVWDFVATVADWRCSLCFKPIEFGELEIYGRSRLCPKCSVTLTREDWEQAGNPAGSAINS